MMSFKKMSILGGYEPWQEYGIDLVQVFNFFVSLRLLMY